MTKTEQKRAALYAAIKTHGETLLAIFPNAKEQDPVKLCKKLRRIEAKAHKMAEDYCNGEIDSDEWEEESAGIARKLCRLFDVSESVLFERGFFVNGDPRGYALKLCDKWTKAFNDERTAGSKARLATDWGGYGIIAPDLTNN